MKDSLVNGPREHTQGCGRRAGLQPRAHLHVPPWLGGWLLRGLLVLLAVLLGLDILDLFAGDWLPGWLTAQTDLAGTANFAAALAASIGVGVGLVAWGRAARSRCWERLRWAILGVGCVAYALTDLLLDRPHGLSRLALVVVAGVCFLLLYGQLRSSRSALALLWLAAAIVATNPLVDRYEVLLTGSPGNYLYRSHDEPYQMTVSAWNRLALARLAQESSETLALILVLKLVLFDADRKAPAPVTARPGQGRDAAER